LDKDNCFAYPKSNEVYKPYEVCSWPISPAILSETFKSIHFYLAISTDAC
jgi:hypothetical protein